MNNCIPFVDLVTQHRDLESEMVEVFREALRTGRFVGGPMVENFEKEFSAFCDTRHCVGVGSGTDALRFALIASGVKRGDMVITVPNTFIATIEAISQAGGFPAFVDIDERTYTMDTEKLCAFLERQCSVDGATGRLVHCQSGRPVTAVIPVHLYGQIAEMDGIMEIAEHHRLIVIEDACQAHGAAYYSRREKRWRTAGSMGTAAAFSFYPGKNLGACGEAGAVTTDDDEIAGKVRMLRDHGQAEKYMHQMEGYNGRLDAIQAGILRIKLRQLPSWNERRRKHALQYDRSLGEVNGVIIPYVPPRITPVYHLYVIRTQRRDELQEHLQRKNIFPGLHYPIPLHRQQAYQSDHYKNGDLIVSEIVSREILSLPMYPGLTEEQIVRVAEEVKHLPAAAGTAHSFSLQI